jgi:hypothetical protein
METEIRFEPTIYIALGTSAGQILWRLKQFNHQAYGDIPILRYLWVDTDNTPDPAAAHWFTSMERAELIGFNGDEVLANLNMYPSIRAWWPRDTRLKPGFIRRGAGQIRLHGRLSLFRMFNDRASGPALIDKLRAQLDALQLIENYDITEQMSKPELRFTVERGGIRVVIFFSACGATGSSMSNDFAYLCRHLLGSNATLVGVVLLPPVMDKAIKNETHTQWEKIRANTYAWFKEHEYLLKNPYWRVNYPEGAPVNLQATPFDLAFVVDLGNQAGDRLSSEDDVFSMVAQAIFLDTGSSIGGALRGFNANVSVLLEEFQGRRRAYSSLAAASLIFPVNKILGYASARLGQSIIQHGLMAEADPYEVVTTTSALISRLGLRDTSLIGSLLTDRLIPNLSAPAIRKAATIQAIRNHLTAQESQDSQERNHQSKQIAEQAGEKLVEIKAALRSELTSLVAQRGMLFAQSILKTLVADPGGNGAIPEDTASIQGLKARLIQHGVSETDLTRLQTEYQAAKEHLRSLEGDSWQVIWRALSKKSWLRELDHTRADILNTLTELNQISLQLAAQREASNLYQQMIETIRSLQPTLAEGIQTALRTSEILEHTAQENLKPDGLEQGIYELALEAVDANYIQAYYQQACGSIDSLTAYRTFTASLTTNREHAFGGNGNSVRSANGNGGSKPVQDPLHLLTAWNEREFARQLQESAKAYFQPALNELTLLEALNEYHGGHAPAIISAMFDRLVRYCHPFWQYNQNSGLQGQEGKSIIGVEDEHSELIPPRYRNDTQYELKSTGFKHRIDVARVQHGLPAFLLRGMNDYKAYYDARRKGLDPLHVLPEAASFAEVLPEERQEARQTFAVACAFGYVVQIGSWYYFDPFKEYTSKHIHPGRENRLDQGRENAESVFSQRDDLVSSADLKIENEIAAMGNRAAIAHLGKSIAELKTALANMSPENELRCQYEKEIQALQEKQQSLGYVPEQIIPASQ